MKDFKEKKRFWEEYVKITCEIQKYTSQKFWAISFSIPNPPILNPQSPILNPQSPILNPQSPILNPQSSIPNPQNPQSPKICIPSDIIAKYFNHKYLFFNGISFGIQYSIFINSTVEIYVWFKQVYSYQWISLNLTTLVFHTKVLQSTCSIWGSFFFF